MKQYGYKDGERPSLRRPATLYLEWQSAWYKFSISIHLWDWLTLQIRLPRPFSPLTAQYGGLWLLSFTIKLYWLLHLTISIPVWYSRLKNAINKYQGRAA